MTRKIDRRRRLANWMIRTGLLLQIVFLALVDWGSIAGMARESSVPWAHVGGLVVVNVVLGAAAVLAWRMMTRAQARAYDPR